MYDDICLGCNKRKRSKSDKYYNVTDISLTSINNLRETFNEKKRKLDKVDTVPEAAKFCSSCYKITINKPQLSIDLTTPDLTIFRKGLNCHSRCTFGCKNPKELIAVPSSIREKLLMNYKYLILWNSRMCSTHLDEENFWPLVKQVSQEVEVNDYITISNFMYDFYQKSKNDKKCMIDVDNLKSIKDEAFKAWFGFNKPQFLKVCGFTNTCEKKQVAVLLCKLRTSLSNQLLSLLFGCCETTIENYLNLARKDLMENLVPKLINNSSRETMIIHNTPIARTLFDIPEDKFCSIWDATYRLAQKSKNFTGQKQLWSEQKKMPLTKPMVACAPDGYILYVLGPYDAKHNDASILKDCFSRFEKELSAIQEDDVFIVDNGFRDVMSFLSEEKNIRAFIPGTGERTTLQANLGRFVTKVRWIIEQVFGRLKKKFKLFALPAHNSTLAHDYQYLLIAFALLNLFHKPILTDEGHDNIAAIMKARLNTPNRLKEAVQAFNLTKQKVVYDDVEYTLMNNKENNALLRFPKLSEDDLYEISLGPYQIKNAISYYTEHLHEDTFLVQKFEPHRRHPSSNLDYADYNIVVADPLLIKAYMKSRYRSGKNHHIFVLVDRAKEGKDSVAGYYCTCESGSRTVGCCSHVMTIIWYLGFDQYNQILTPNPNICEVSITIPKELNETDNNEEGESENIE